MMYWSDNTSSGSSVVCTMGISAAASDVLTYERVLCYQQCILREGKMTVRGRGG